ncbi:MAG: hypothetical protein V2J10_09670 [Wenzhouxiangella sp.]|nr:hypothetical protein [Wenzhouxiangella sp.]
MAMIYKGLFCVNAAAVEKDGETSVFCGTAGSGRSTAAARVALEGGRIVTDSVARIDPEEDGAKILPQGRGVLLWPDSLRRLGICEDQAAQLRSDSQIRQVNLEQATSPQHIERIYWHNPHPATHRIEFKDDRTRDLSTSQRFKRLALMTSGRLWIDPAGRSAEHSRWCLTIARKCLLQPAPPHFFGWADELQA